MKVTLMPKDWWKNFFDENYLLFWKARGRFKHTKQEVNFLVRNIPLKSKSSVLDLCCGHGRHSIELARRGHKVTGLDYSKFELAIAKEEARRAGFAVDFVVGDARKFNLRKKFDAVLNMFTAFGYGTREDDQDILDNVSRHLKPNGKFFIDTFNLIWLFRNFKSKKHERLSKGIYAISERTFDFEKNVNHENRIIFSKGHQRGYNLFLQLYTLPEMIEMLNRAGLKFQKVWGSFAGEPYGLKSKRMIILAKKM